MRKIMMIATLVAASSAFAGGEPQEIPDQNQQVQQAPRRAVRRDARPVQSAMVFNYVGYAAENIIDVSVIVDGLELRFRGDDSHYGNIAGCGDLVLMSAGRDGLTGRAPLGKFARVGDIGVLVEIADGTGSGIITLLRRTNRYSGLKPATSEVKITDGHALDYYRRDLRTGVYNWVDLTVLFKDSQDVRDFMENLVDTPNAPRDVTQMCASGNCDNYTSDNGLGPVYGRNAYQTRGPIVGPHPGMVLIPGPTQGGVWNR